MGTPLKLNGSDGDVKYLSTTEENYLAYQIGLALRDGNRNSESSLDNLSGDTTVGTYSDTVYDQAVGTHGTTLTTTTTNKSLYQNTGTASESGTDFKRPIHWNTALTPDSIQEMTDANFNSCVDRLLTTVFTNDYPGTFKLGSTAPSADYSAFLGGDVDDRLFTDTTLNGTPVNYSIWKRNAITAPSAIYPMGVKRVSGNGEVDDFDGLQPMTDAEIKYSFGQRAKTRISASGIGTYQLRNSSQGAPSATGTWVAKGTALDTINEVNNIDYTTNYSGDYGANYTRNSTTVFAGDYAAAYTGDFAGDYTGDFTGNYITSVGYASNFTGDFVGAYAGDVNYTGNSTNTYIGNYAGNVTYVGTSTTSSTASAVTASVGNYLGNEDVASTRTSTSIVGYECEAETPQNAIYQDFTGNYTSDGAYAGDYISAGSTIDYTRNSTATSTNAFVGNYIGADYTSSSTAADITASVGNYLGNNDMSSTRTRSSLDDFATGETNYFVGNYAFDGAYAGDYVTIGSITNSTINSTSNFIGNYAGDYAVVTASNFTRTRTTNYNDNLNYFVGNYAGTRSSNFIGDYAGNYTGDFTGDYVGNFVLTSVGNFGATYAGEAAGNFVGDFVGNYLGDSVTASVANFAGDYVGEVNSTRNSTGNYAGDYAGNVDYISNSTSDFVGDFVGAVDSTRNSTSAYVGNSTLDSNTTYAGDYTGDFTGDYSAAYTGNYVGNYLSSTIASSHETVDTYTLYVRVS